MESFCQIGLSFGFTSIFCLDFYTRLHIFCVIVYSSIMQICFIYRRFIIVIVAVGVSLKEIKK